MRDTPVLLMEKLDGYETDVVAFTTDLPSLTNWGRPLLLGPGSISMAHTERECVRKADLVAASRSLLPFGARPEKQGLGIRD